MTELTGPETAKLRKALKEAFSQIEMAMLMSDSFDLEIYAIVPLRDYESQVRCLIDYFRSRGILPDLVAVARKHRPNNQAIATIAGILGIAD